MADPAARRLNERLLSPPRLIGRKSGSLNGGSPITTVSLKAPAILPKATRGFPDARNALPAAARAHPVAAASRPNASNANASADRPTPRATRADRDAPPVIASRSLRIPT
jgi:hypothetical protein